MPTFANGESAASVRTKINDAIDKVDGAAAITSVNIDSGAIDGVTLGTNSAVTEAQIDNININGNAIISTDTNGNIALTPNGTGEVDISKVDIDGGTIDGVTIGGASAGAGTFTTLTATGDVDIADKIVHTGDTNTAIRFPAADTVTVETAGAERLRIDSSGNVGIGTSSPVNILQTYSTGNTLLATANAAGGTGYVGVVGTAYRVTNLNASSATEILGSGQITIKTAGGSPITLSTSDIERMRIDSSGNVGIGETSPSSYGKLAILDGATRFWINESTTNEMMLSVGASERMLFGINGAEAMRIDSSGRVGIGELAPLGKLHTKSGDSGVVTVNVSGDDFIVENSGNTGMSLFGPSTTAGYLIWGNELNNAAGFVGYIHPSNSMQFATNATERMRIDSSGRVGIGTTTTTGFDSGADELIVGSGSGNTGMTIYSGTASYGSLHFADANSSPANYVGYINYRHSTNSMQFATSSTEAMRIDSSGNVVVGDTSALGGGKVSTAVDLSVENGFVVKNTAASYGPTHNLFRAINSASASVGGLTHTAATDMGVWGYSNLILSTGASATERMRIDSSGNVGIGTSSPSDPLHVDSQNGNAAVRLNANTGYNTSINFYNNNVVKWAAQALGDGSNAFRFYNFTASTEAMRIDSSGNLLVGTTNAAGILTINGDQTYFTTSSATNASLTLRKGAAGADGVDFFQCRDSANNAEFIIQGDGDAQNTNNSYGAISDAKLKENVTDATPKLDKLNQVRVVNYNLIGHERKQIGVIAQELEQIFPSMVQDVIDRDAEGNDLGTTTKSVKYSVFVPMLIKAMQEQQAIIEDLKARLDAANL
jgi:hypothetical protein